MSFTQSTFAPVGPQSTNAPSVYSYTTIDNIADAEVSEYFAVKKHQLETGDIVISQCADGFAILDITSSSTVEAVNIHAKAIRNRVVVNEAADFPATVGGKIPTVANTEYYIGSNDVSVDVEFTLATNVAFTGTVAASNLIYTGSGSMFEGSDPVGWVVRGLTFDMPNGGQLFDIADTVPGTTTINLADYRILQGGKLGTAEDVFAVVSNQGQMLDIDDGLTMIGNNSVVSITENAMISTNSAFIGVDLGASISPTIEINNLLCVAPTGAIGISGAADNANLPANSIGSVASCEFLGGMDALENITRDDFRWRFTANSGIPDTNPDALLSLTGNALETAIVTQGVGVQINAVWTVGRDSHFTGSTDGSVAYDGERPISVPIGIDAGLLSAAGTFDAYLQIAIDGVPIVSGVAVAVNTNKPTFARVQFQHDFINGEVLTVLAVNVDGTGNIIVESAVNMIR